MTNKILITGAAGQLGAAFCALDWPQHNIIALNRTQLDITNQQQVHTIITQHQPSIILNCAAYTKVDQAESEPNLAKQINSDGPLYLAKAAEEIGATLIHFSTDYVFDGTKTTPYTETDVANPINIYGQTKLAGEQAVLEYCRTSMVLRSSWLYGPTGTNFPKTLLNLAAKGKTEFNVVDDQIGCPTSVITLAKIVQQMLQQNDKNQLVNKSGLYHLAATNSASWYEFAKAIFADQPAIKIQPITSADWPTPAKRPSYSALNSQKFVDTFNITPPTWQDMLAETLPALELHAE